MKRLNMAILLKMAILPMLCLSSLLLAGCGQNAADDAQLGSVNGAFTTTPVAAYGQLKVVENRICDKNGNPVQLRGMSLFWSNTGWGGERFFNATLVNNLADTWNASIVRAPIGVEGTGGYLESSTAAAANTARVKAVVDAAIAKGIYVIIDWHYSSATLYTSEAQTFFTQMAQTYGSYPNVIFEIYNEPTTNTWSSIKTYANTIIGAIRGAGSTNLVVVGTPTWSQDVDVAAADPITAYTNVAYTLHFYAGTHGASLRAKADTAMSKGVAVFVTEYGTCDASGDGNLSLTESANWATWMNTNKISSCNWSMNDKAETASALVTGASATGPWPDSQLTASGAWVKAYVLPGYTESGSGGTTYALTVTEAGTGTGTGTVTSSPSGVSCGSTCSASFASGTSVTLTAAAASGSTFAGWSGACTGTGTCTVTMSAARSVTATFNTSSGGTTCANPITFTTGDTGNFGTTGAVCYRTNATINGWGCSNTDGRTITVGGVAVTCGKTPLTKSSDGYYYFAVSAGTYAWASLYTY